MTGEKLYQNLTSQEIIDQLRTFVEYYKEEEQRIPLCMVAAIEYIWLNENKRRRKNAKKTENNINQNGTDPVR